MRILPFQLLRHRGIGSHLKGLLEVEPLHFTCCAMTEATRVENMDSQSSSHSSNIVEDIIFEASFENMDTIQSNGPTSIALIPPITGNGTSMIPIKKNDHKLHINVSITDYDLNGWIWSALVVRSFIF